MTTDQTWPLQDRDRPVIVVFEDESVPTEFVLRTLESHYTVMTFRRITDGLEALDEADLVFTPLKN